MNIDELVKLSKEQQYDEFTSAHLSRCEQLLDYKELSYLMKLKENTLRQWVMQRRIPFFKLGRSVRFRLSDIEEWLSRNKVEQIGGGK